METAIKLSHKVGSFKHYINQVEAAIVEQMGKGLRDGKLKEEDLPIIADFVLNSIDKIKTHDEIIGLLSHLSVKWSVFSEIATMEEGKLKKLLEKKTAEDMLKLIQAGDMVSAAQLARRVIN